MGFFSFLLALILQCFEIAYPELLMHPALCTPNSPKYLQMIEPPVEESLPGEQSTKVRSMGMLPLAELSPIQGGRPPCSSSACNGHHRGVHTGAQIRPVQIFSISHSFLCQTQILGLNSSAVPGNNSDKIQKRGAAVHSVVSWSHLILHVLCLLCCPAPQLCQGWKAGYHGAWRTR